ncbi:hypothetical protein FC19_GL001903 [Liquorilactobacillus aquaticus DSM 21051]|uniref:HTH tetR-type domain-containing protein n=1 Tax=Liquorilactobacillus aquaticus DSM 21051 TaxID=1423725 RepID=A0A0R2D9I3_9LACO|nr:TetR/AcrR family transcriptional regulator [Liquorilactobacillus aquaticus]KRM97259.1 hypothetical protein FC19_GL001903 [Liquorilactobacillus aquaticus DSM 21051]
MSINDEIYLAILHLLEEKGPAFTTEELASELKVSKRTIYKMFGSKEMIIDKAIDFVFKDICLDDNGTAQKERFSSDEMLQRYLIEFHGTEHVDKIIKHAKTLEKRYPQQWSKLNNRIDEFGKKLYDLFIVDPHVRILTATEKAVLLLMIQQTTRKFLQNNYLVSKGLNFKAAIQALYKMILSGIYC